jgi:pyruvate ferredoxin oxidoreductase alpha subunit
VVGALDAYRTEDAERILVASGTVATTLRDVVDEARGRGEKVGMVRVKMFRPFPRDELRRICAGAQKIGVLDRNYAAGTGGIFCQELRAALQGARGEMPWVQGYLVGVGGGDVVPDIVRDVVQDLAVREAPGETVWTGIDA